MLVVLTDAYCNKVNIQVTQRDDFIQKASSWFLFFSYHNDAQSNTHQILWQSTGHGNLWIIKPNLAEAAVKYWEHETISHAHNPGMTSVAYL